MVLVRGTGKCSRVKSFEAHGGLELAQEWRSLISWDWETSITPVEPSLLNVALYKLEEHCKKGFIKS